jgi:choline dehydrogenase-like flavoprotein
VDSESIPADLSSEKPIKSTLSGRNSGVERNLAKVEVEGSNPSLHHKLEFVFALPILYSFLVLIKSDYIVIGGGASGCAVTSSLLKSNLKVTLFEAGHSHHNFLLNVPAGFFKLLNNTKYAEYYKTNPQHHLGKKVNIIPQGNVLGGGTSINSQIYMRGRSEDYNEWNKILRVNNDTVNWGWDAVFPYFKNMENNERFENKYHGKQGKLNISDSKFVNPLTYDFIDSVSNLGIEKTNDFNGEFQKGVGKYQYMNSKGQRSSAAHAFIDPEMNNQNLKLKLNSKVIKIIIENLKNPSSIMGLSVCVGKMGYNQIKKYLKFLIKLI